MGTQRLQIGEVGRSSIGIDFLFGLVVFGIVWDLRHDCRYLYFFVCSLTLDGNDFIEIESPGGMIGFSCNEVKQTNKYKISKHFNVILSGIHSRFFVPQSLLLRN